MGLSFVETQAGILLLDPIHQPVSLVGGPGGTLLPGSLHPTACLEAL